GAGKSTVAKALASKLGITYVDTGALYRTVGLYTKERGVDPKDEAGVSALLDTLNIRMTYEDGVQHLYLNGHDVGDSIRTQEISMYASAVSAHPAVRAFLLATQRDIAKTQSIVMDGRDIGTVIFPDAEVKIFLTASPENRAQRRYDELIAKGQNADYETVLAEIKTRDHNDSARAVAPLRPAEDAVLLDNTGFTVEQSVAAVMQILEEKLGDRL
ncbi:MAG: (d)CMP kinase, partial [Clostridia bacterium]|nr:(d)CMP kinase [Clostridia bacterium]